MIPCLRVEGNGPTAYGNKQWFPRCQLLYRGRRYKKIHGRYEVYRGIPRDTVYRNTVTALMITSFPSSSSSLITINYINRGDYPEKFDYTVWKLNKLPVLANIM